MAIYRDIATDICRQIADGILEPGAQLPTFEELATRYTVSTFTIQRTVRLLVHDGYLRSIRGHGTYVTNTPPPALILRVIRALETGEPISADDTARLIALLWALLPPG